MPYTNSDEFAIWCKTGNRSIHRNETAKLATYRMTGRVWAWVHDIGKLKRGDQVAWNDGTVYYYQHAIVSSIEGISFLFTSSSTSSESTLALCWALLLFTLPTIHFVHHH